MHYMLFEEMQSAWARGVMTYRAVVCRGTRHVLVARCRCRGLAPLVALNVRLVLHTGTILTEPCNLAPSSHVILLRAGIVSC